MLGLCLHDYTFMMTLYNAAQQGLVAVVKDIIVYNP